MASSCSLRQDSNEALGDDSDVGVRSLSTSPARRPEPAGKLLQLVAVGNRFCLARQPQLLPRKSASEEAAGRERPAVKGLQSPPTRGDSIERRSASSSGWPTALRSRSSSDERSIHRCCKFVV